MGKTEDNLLKAFAGECQATNTYLYFAKAASKEGLHPIEAVFLESAENERQHAKDIFKLLEGIADTKTNLRHAIDGEKHEHASMYPEFARIARQEGKNKAAVLFEQIAKVEKVHEERFRRLLTYLDKNNLWKRDEPTKWICAKCGYVHEGVEAPTICPCCKHPQEYFHSEII